MKVRCARSGCSSEKTGVPRRRGALGRRLSRTGARCGRVTCEVGRWLLRRRRIAADQFLRGACYGAGTAAVGLLAVWAQTR
ncbi:hypothetical protein FHS33_001948 [Streptomyces calvus]|uniref:Uncharacterized protein n=2 Tax=Streptomyces TaxID=1883 RepID=A0AA40SBM1_9ACTN|nr:hypothetical protein [Streptomyces calvus]MBA8977168.1 hypothetical protein [Streptomyces calvus]